MNIKKLTALLCAVVMVLSLAACGSGDKAENKHYTVGICQLVQHDALGAATKPIVAGEEGICKGCGVATLSIDYYELGRTTGEMAVKILKGEADISTMAIEYYPNPVKKYNPEMAEHFNLTIPSDYAAIG